MSTNDSNELSAVRDPASVFCWWDGPIKVTISREETEKGSSFNVTVSRFYKSGDIWCDSHSLRYEDLLPAMDLLRQCHSFIWGEIARQR